MCNFHLLLYTINNGFNRLFMKPIEFLSPNLIIGLCIQIVLQSLDGCCCIVMSLLGLMGLFVEFSVVV